MFLQTPATQCWQNRNNLLWSQHEAEEAGSSRYESPSRIIRNLGDYIDNEMNMYVHIEKICSVCSFYLCCLRQLGHIVSKTRMQRLTSAFILSCFDYCNLVLDRSYWLIYSLLTYLVGLLDVTLMPMQRVVNSAVHHMHDQVTPTMWALHWLPIKFRIRYKLCILMHAAVNDHKPEYINTLLVPVSTLRICERLRSTTSGAFYVPKTKTEFSKWAFSVAGPAA